MSIKNLYSENLKNDQNIRVESVNYTGQLSCDKHLLDYLVYFQPEGSPFTITTKSGVLAVQNLNSLSPFDGFNVVVNYPPFTANQNIQLVSGISIGAGSLNMYQLSIAVLNTSPGQFTIRVYNTSGFLFTGGPELIIVYYIIDS